MDDEKLETLLTKEDVCRMLQMKESWLNIEIQTGRISYLRLGRKKYIRFRPEHIREYLDSRESKVQTEPYPLEEIEEGEEDFQPTILTGTGTP